MYVKYAGTWMGYSRYVALVFLERVSVPPPGKYRIELANPYDGAAVQNLLIRPHRQPPVLLTRYARNARELLAAPYTLLTAFGPVDMKSRAYADCCGSASVDSANTVLICSPSSANEPSTSADASSSSQRM